MSLPYLDERGPADKGLVGEQTAGEARASGRILIVDDNADALAALHMLLKLQGFDAQTAHGGERALSLLQQERFDVVLLDLVMPTVSGEEILEFAVTRKLDTKIIVVSGNATFDGARHALQHGAFDFIKKPFEALEVTAAVRRALGQCELEQQNRAMARQLRDSEALHRFIVTNSPDLVYMLDERACFTFANERASSLLGVEADTLIGQPIAGFLRDPDDPARFALCERRTGKRAARHVELCLRQGGSDPGRGNGSDSVWVEVAATGVYREQHDTGRGGFLGTFGTLRDVGERGEAQAMVSFQAYHDLLTKLPNRALLQDRIEMAITHARRNEFRVAVMFLDLDGFKEVNDELGHANGDRALRAVASRLSGCLRQGDTLARFGGDEFAILIPHVNNVADVHTIANKIICSMERPFTLDDSAAKIGVSIGVAIYPDAGATRDVLLRNADLAMYRAKSNGRNNVCFYSSRRERDVDSRFMLDTHIQEGIERDEFVPYYQPQISLKSGRLIGLEALARWHHPERGVLAPSEFMHQAEEIGLGYRIDECIQRQVIRDVSRWRHPALASVRLSMNISLQWLSADEPVETLLHNLGNSRIQAERLMLEITEHVLMQDWKRIVPRCRALREAGVKIALDDFGVGYSSLAYLQRMPLDALKIDRSFTAEIRDADSDATLVDAIIGIARGLDLCIVAEGIEHSHQAQYLRRHACDEGQGFYFGHPVAADNLVDVLQAEESGEQCAEWQ